MPTLFVFWTLFSGALIPSSAFANNAKLDEAKKYYEEADFNKALDVVDRAELGTGLSRLDLLDLLTIRAMVHFALDDERSLHATLVKLASLAPNFVFPKSAPPAIRDKFRDAKKETSGQLQLKVVVSRQSTRLAIHPEIEHDPGKLVRETRLYTRQGKEPWKLSAGVSVEYPLGVGLKVDYYAEAIGPGGALIAADGSRTVPKEIVVTPTGAGDEAAGVDPLQGGPADSGGGISTGAWIAIGVGAAAVAAAVVVILVAKPFSKSASDNTQISPPTIGGIAFP